MNQTAYRALSALLLVSSTLAFAGTVAAQPRETDTRARQLYLRGDRFYQEGRYEEAVAAFQEAFDLSQRPLLHFNLANAYERLGRLEEALASLRAYAPHAPVEEEDQIRARIDNLSQRLEAQQTQTDTTTTTTTTDSTTGTQATTAVSVTTPPPPPYEEPPIERGDGGLIAAGAVVTGLGVVLATGGIVFGVMANDARSQAAAQCGLAGTTRICNEAARAPLDRGSSYAVLADVGIIVGAAAIVGGVVLLVAGATSTHPGERETAEQGVTVVPTASFTSSGGIAGVAGTF
jgi:tetratricopeptide (TPR) repeat protein